MQRSILAILALALVSALPAAAQTPRPSISSVDAAQKRTDAAICAKADADGDSYRPFVCDPRCDCLAPLLLQSTPNSCEETAPGVFAIGEVGPPTCSGGYCVGAGGSVCVVGGFPGCPAGQQCVTSCGFGICFSSCRQPCSSSATCSPIPGPGATLSGVSAPDSPNPVQCTVQLNPLDPAGATTSKINSNDALECIAQVEVSTPCD